MGRESSVGGAYAQARPSPPLGSRSGTLWRRSLHLLSGAPRPQPPTPTTHGSAPEDRLADRQKPGKPAGSEHRSGRGQGGGRGLSSRSRCGGDRRGGDGAAGTSGGGRQGSREAATQSQWGLGGGGRGDPERSWWRGDSKCAGSQGDGEDKS